MKFSRLGCSAIPSAAAVSHTLATQSALSQNIFCLQEEIAATDRNIQVVNLRAQLQRATEQNYKDHTFIVEPIYAGTGISLTELATEIGSHSATLLIRERKVAAAFCCS